MEIDAHRSRIEGGCGRWEEVCPRKGCRIGESGYHDGRKEGSGEAFKFNLLRCGNEADGGGDGCVE